LHYTISKSLFKNHFIIDKDVCLIAVTSLTRYNSTKRFFSSIRPLANNEELLALDYINNERHITSSIGPTPLISIKSEEMRGEANEILLKKNLSVNDSKLKELLKVKGVELDLPISTASSLISSDLIRDEGSGGRK